MSDANLSADKIRAMLSETLERLRKASAEYFDLLEKGLGSRSCRSPIRPSNSAATWSAMSPRHSTSATS